MKLNCNVFYNLDFSDRVITGSFDKTSKIWNVETGQCLATLWGHTREVVCAQFSPENDYIATASMDHTARIYDVNTGT